MLDKSSIALFVSIMSVSLAAILIISCDSHPLVISLYRMLFTTLIISSFILIKKEYRVELLKVNKKQLLMMVGIGIILAFHFMFWITSLTLTSVASSVILVTAHPILVGPMSHILLKERLSFRNGIGILCAIFGIIILVYGNYGFSSSIDSFEGNVLAFLGGIAAGFYILGGRHMRNKLSVIPYVFIVYSVSTVVIFLFSSYYSVSIISISIRDLGIILVMAIIAGIFGHTLYNWSLAKVRASLASVALLGEPIGSAFFAYIIPWIHQIPTRYTIIGGGIILVGIFLTAKNKKYLLEDY